MYSYFFNIYYPSAEIKRMTNRKIYLDHASSALKASANPSAIHELGVEERRKLEVARARAARVLGARKEEVIFTSGATESNNLAILGMPRGHIVTTNIEHASVVEPALHKGNVTFVEVESSGIVDAKKIEKAIKKDTVLVSVMYANNEIGTVQPIREIAKVIRHYNKNHKNKVYLHTDAVQAVNYLPINIMELGVDLLSLNAAKIYGPKGVGLLYVRKGTPLGKIMFGGNQENGLRPGTENVEAVEALAKALENAEKIKSKEVKRLTALRDYFVSKVSDIAVLNGDLVSRLPNNINITIPKIPSELLVIELSARGIMCSSKSACKAGDGKASHVLKAINKDASETDGSLRITLGKETTKADLDYTIKSLREILKKLEKWYN